MSGQCDGGTEGEIGGGHVGGAEFDAGAVKAGCAGETGGVIRHLDQAEFDSDHDGLGDLKRLGGSPTAQALKGMDSGVVDSPLGDFRRQTFGGEEAGRLLDFDGLEVAKQGAGLVAGGLVAGNHQDRRAIMTA